MLRQPAPWPSGSLEPADPICSEVNTIPYKTFVPRHMAKDKALILTNHSESGLGVFLYIDNSLSK